MKTRTLTILQADLVGSTTTTSAISREEMADYITEVTAQITHAIRQHNGDPFKFTGDGYLASFESASDALHAALEIQRNMQTRNLTIGGRSVGTLRIIIHTADVIVTDDDLLGDGIATVARLEKMTPPGAVYVTDTTRGVCKRAEFEFHYVDTYILRGLADPIRIYELKSRDRLHVQQDACIMVSDIKRFSRLTSSLPPQELETHLSMLHRIHREAARVFSGILTKIMGDKALIIFHNANDAVSAALALQESTMTHNRQHIGSLPIHLTVGIAFGDIYRFSGDIYGSPVNDAFLMASRLDDYSIAMTEAVYNRLEIDRQMFRLLEEPTPEWPDCQLTIYAANRLEPLT